MTAAIALMIVLIFISAMLTAVMLIAWWNFGRPRHALVWAIGFAVATLQWGTNLALRTVADGAASVFAVMAALSCLSNALIAVGFIQRNPAATRLRIRLLLGCAGLATLPIAAVSVVMPHVGLRDAMVLLFASIMMGVSAANVGSSLRSRTAPERAVRLVLILFALLHLAMAATALQQGPAEQGDTFLLVHKVLLVLLLPPAFIGVGLFSVFLVAADLAENLRRLATADVLTGIYNRRGFDDAAERAIRNAQRQHQPLSVVVADIDNFKTINDRYGHNVGDLALCHFASRLERLVRRGDLIGRIGGEEFALLLVNTPMQSAVEVVERIRRDIAAMPVGGPDRVAMTASFGVTGLRPGDISLGPLLARADRAMYRSKLDGRDRVTAAEDMEEA